MAELFLLLGGNLGDKAEIFEKAGGLITEKIGKIIKNSSIYETEPWGFESEDLFWNQVLIVETKLVPEEVLKFAKWIEDSIGRIRKEDQYVSRLIDIDLLFYDDLIIETDQLQIPHPRMIDRRFVLVPLNEVADSKTHPVFGKKVSELLNDCNDNLGVEKLINF
jgi:2-amino-4-hydroxy-6-hydroxymethyldihydropteridine diphosphokinase